jgi:hypothetical protein
MFFACSYKHLLAFDYKRTDNQTFIFGDKKVIEDTLNRIATALENMVQLQSEMLENISKQAEVAQAAPVEQKQKAGPGRPRKYPRPEDGAKYPAESTAAAPVAADQPEVSEVSNTGNDRGVAPSVLIPPPDVIVPEPAEVVSATPAVDVIPEPTPTKVVGEDEIREAMIALRRVRDREGVLEVLKQFGVKGVSELDPASFPDVIKAVEAAIA